VHGFIAHSRCVFCCFRRDLVRHLHPHLQVLRFRRGISDFLFRKLDSARNEKRRKKMEEEATVFVFVFAPKFPFGTPLSNPLGFLFLGLVRRFQSIFS
jgi:hypothetical protein